MKIIIEKITDILFPPRCLYCNEIIISQGALCSKCWIKIDFISNPKCYICSHPFEYEITKDSICLSCIKTKPIYDKAHVLFKYNEHSNKIIHKLKYCDCTYLAPYLAKFMHKIIDDVDYDFIVPVPIHKIRLLKRLYNQSLILAQYLHKLTNIDIIPDLLVKSKNIPPQSSLGRKERKKNVKSAFLLNKKYSQIIINKKILLVDDVITTGSTVNYCSGILKQANVKRVEIAALGKT